MRRMGASHRGLIITVLICIAAVGVAAGLKLGPVRSAMTSLAHQMNLSKDDDLSLDASFFEGGSGSASSQASRQSSTAIPPVSLVSAEAYVVGDLQSGRIYASRNANSPLPIASMSKLMTALVAADTISATTTVEITAAEASVYPDLSDLKAGERFTAGELMYPLLMSSSNVAAEALASSTDRIKFLDLMNGYAWEIGLPKSFFADPSGLSPRNAASAEGFFALAQYVYRTHPGLLAITRMASSSFATTTEHGSHLVPSIHPFIADPRFLGGKTGHTPEAGDTMLTILKIGGRPIAFVVLGSMDRRRDTLVLIDELGDSLAKK
jgi:D-alanyl-D-alanine endopeptidase (penicillin-binding protein 7)